MSWLSPPAANIQLPTSMQFPTNNLAYDPSQIAPVQNAMLGGISNLGQYNTYAGLMPQAQNIGQGMISDPNAASFTGGAGTAAGLGENAALGMYGAGQQIYGTAFDPQQDLYNRTLARTTDSSRANAMAAGLGTTPLGVSATDWATNQFNIDWQNQQLQRQIAGSQAAAGLQGAAAPLFMQSAGYPYAASQQVGQNQLGTLNQLGQFGINAAQIPGQQIQGWQNSLGLMGGLQSQANQQQQQQFADYYQLAQLQLQQANQAFQQQQSMFGGLGKILGGVGGFALGGMPGAAVGSSIFGGGGGGGGGGGIPGTGWGGQNTGIYNPFMNR